MALSPAFGLRWMQPAARPDANRSALLVPCLIWLRSPSSSASCPSFPEAKPSTRCNSSQALSRSLAMQHADNIWWCCGASRTNHTTAAPMKDRQEIDTCLGYRLSDDVHLRSSSDAGYRSTCVQRQYGNRHLPTRAMANVLFPRVGGIYEHIGAVSTSIMVLSSVPTTTNNRFLPSSPRLVSASWSPAG